MPPTLSARRPAASLGTDRADPVSRSAGAGAGQSETGSPRTQLRRHAKTGPTSEGRTDAHVTPIDHSHR